LSSVSLVFARGGGDYAVAAKPELPLIFKYSCPQSVTKGSAASIFRRMELENSWLVMSWRVAFSVAEAELSPKKPLWFIPVAKLALVEHGLVRVV
jgi:hypothetical protein